MDPTNRTFVCSVLFLDIAEYSRRSVAEQMLLKQRFNTLLSKALRRIPGDERIVLDTGDGAAVSFLGSPEDTLFVATGLRDAVASDEPGDPARLSLRLGINLGPVRLIKDLNGQLNIIGDGINVAQRVMSFAAAGQILVSRSYYEVVSRLDPQFSQIFHYEGARTDKHVREHEVYAVGLASPRWRPYGADGRAPPAPMAPRSKRLFIALPLTMALILSAGVAARLQRDDPLTATAHSPALQKTLPLFVSAHAETPPLDEPPRRAALGPQPVPKRIVPREDREKDKDKDKDKAAPAEPGAATLLVVPWGEVIVDGKSRGVTPPLRQVELAPGRHQIEIRNGTFPPHTQTVMVRSGEKVTIRHKFK